MPRRCGREAVSFVLGFLSRSLAKKLAVAIAVPCGLAALVGLTLLLDEARRAVREDTDEELAALAEQVATAFELAEPGADPHRAVAAAMRADGQPMGHVRDLRILGRDGVVRWSRRVEERGTRHAEAERILRLEAVPGREVIRPLGGMECASCHTKDAFLVGALELSIDEPKLVRDVSSLYRSALWGVLGLTALLALVLVVSIRTLFIQPLQRLKLLMRRAEQGDFLVRAQVDRDDELGELAGAFNTMLAKITDLNVAALETGREVDRMQEELRLKAELEKQAKLIEQTNQRLEARLTELTLLFDLTRSMNSTLELGELLKLVTEMVGVTLGFHEFAVLLVDEPAGELVVSASWGFPEDAGVEGLRFKLTEGVSGEAARSGEVVLVADVSKEERFLWYRGRLQRAGSFLAVPMIHKHKVVGLLNFSRPEVGAFSAEEVKLLKSVAGQAALAIANARLYQETVELSLTDPLTGVHNRRHLFARLEMEITRAQRFGNELSLVMIDVDHFKHYNDANGHSAGDEVLKAVAATLSTSVRKVDTVARFGGEEFSVVLPQIERAEAEAVAEKLRRAIAKTDFAHGDRQPGGRVTISVGFATFPTDAADLATLVDAADSALYASKRGGRNRVTAFEQGMETHPGRERGRDDEKKKRLLDPAAKVDAAGRS